MLLSIIPAFFMLIQRNAGIFLISVLYFSIIALKAVPLKHLKIIGLSYLFSISGFLMWNVQRILIENRPYMIIELLPFFTPTKNYMLTVNDIGGIFYPSLLLFPFSLYFTTAILVMLCYYNQLRATGMVMAKVVIIGSARRLRPVMMTASLTAFGLIPLLFATGPGSEIQRPLAIVVIGGLVSSTFLTLILLPILYRQFGEAKGTVQ